MSTATVATNVPLPTNTWKQLKRDECYRRNYESTFLLLSFVSTLREVIKRTIASLIHLPRILKIRPRITFIGSPPKIRSRNPSACTRARNFGSLGRFPSDWPLATPFPLTRFTYPFIASIPHQPDPLYPHETIPFSSLLLLSRSILSSFPYHRL